MRCVLSIGLLLATACAAGTVVGPVDDTSAAEVGDVDAPAAPADQDPVTDTEVVNTDSDSPPACPPVVVPEATGTTRDSTPGTTLASLLGQSVPGDCVRVQAGTYPAERLTASFSDDVFIEAAPGAVASFAGLTFVASAHLVVRGLSFTDTLDLEGSHHIILERILIDAGTRDVSALVIDGQQSAGANHDIVVTRSNIRGGARTIFLLGTFAPADTWNHDIVVSECDLECGSHNCFQLSGARDMQIVDNYIHDPLGTAVLTAGATRIEIARNRMLGSPTLDATAIQIATPGEWDPYAGNQYMISSDIVVADNIIAGWGGPGISLHAATRIDIVNNTVTTDVGLSTWRRIPHDTDGNVILTGNTAVRLWNNILTTIALDTGDPRPTYETNNLVRSGGGGQALITSDPRFAETNFFTLAADSPAVDAGLATPDTPTVDAFGNSRNGAPDLGANERAGAPPICP